MDKANREMDEGLNRKLDEDFGKQLIYKMTRDRDEDSNDAKTGSVIKDKKDSRSGRIISRKC